MMQSQIEQESVCVTSGFEWEKRAILGICELIDLNVKQIKSFMNDAKWKNWNVLYVNKWQKTTNIRKFNEHDRQLMKTVRFKSPT